MNRFILLVSVLTLHGTTIASARELTCPDELASFQQCISNKPFDCYPTCGEVEVKLKAEDLTYMRNPSSACDPLKFASCAMRNCCEPCAAEEAIYWSCIERETGCGEINCQADSTSNNGDTSTEPQDEEVPPEEDEGSTTNTGGSNGQVADTGDENNGTNGQTPQGDDTDSVTNNGSSTGGSTPTTSSDVTCPGELGLFKQCVSSKSCAASCANVDVTLKAEDLTKTVDPSTLCGPMEAASCGQRSCCEKCALEEFLYWFCIERESGCGAIDCRNVTSSSDGDEKTPVGNEGVTPPTTGGSGTATANNTVPGNATSSVPSQINTTQPTTGTSTGQSNTTKPATGGSTGQDVTPASDEAPVNSSNTNGQSPPQNTTTDGITPTVNTTTNSSTTTQGGTSGANTTTSNAPVGSNVSNSNSGGVTCPNELASFQKCVANQPYYCYPTCGNVEVRLQPEDLMYMRDPSRACNPMKFASCAMRNCCEPCAAEEAIYWSCIESKSGCGEIDCKTLLDPSDGDGTSSARNSGVSSQPEFDAIEGNGDSTTTSGVFQESRIMAWFTSASLLVYMNL